MTASCPSCGDTREVFTDAGWGTCRDCRTPPSSPRAGEPDPKRPGRFIPDVLKGVGHRDEHGNLIEEYHSCGCRQARAGEAEGGVRRFVIAALTDEDEIAHGEAVSGTAGLPIGLCTYCGDDWPCRTQRGIDRLVAALASPEPDEEAR
jgi:hypothetical protein